MSAESIAILGFDNVPRTILPSLTYLLKHFLIDSQIVFFAARPGVLVHVPLNITFFIFQGTASDFEKPHSHSWPDFGQLYTLIARSHKNVMSHFNAVLDVFESDYPVADFLICGCSLTRRENMFEDLTYAFAQRS